MAVLLNDNVTVLLFAYAEAAMSNLSKRSTVYFEPAIHQALKSKAAASDLSISAIVDEAVRLLMRKDQEDLAAFAERASEPEISYVKPCSMTSKSMAKCKRTMVARCRKSVL